MRRYFLFLVITLPILLVLVPAALVMYHTPDPTVTPVVMVEQEGEPYSDNQPQINVFRSKLNQIEKMPLETYIEGVVAAEMPAEFELEALKAQAMAARTYIVRRLAEGNFQDVPKGAHVLDTVRHQAFLGEVERKEMWGKQYEWKQNRIHQAVKGTLGKVLTYEGKPIDATFFSTSNGFTENAEDYWSARIPYLRSVASPWDIDSPRYEQSVQIPLKQFQQKLGVMIVATASDGNWYSVEERTAGNRIGRIKVGEKEFSGKEIREKLSLSSSSFSMKIKQGNVVITTKGYGHGVGMSQWGANGMAKAGKSAEQIVKYYYKGITMQDYQNVMKV
ncbi:hypothetical protein C2W64_03289 [Brevibacillus laterosporus]|nr:stage II sporulation protein D [Brevibacillus laterosporus]RAP29639.1 hypothetical protein C2W64_03289 [Brevibacillus laterosporus]